MEEEASRMRAEELVEQIKELVRRGNIARILVTHKEEIFLNIPLNVGIVGTVLGFAAAPWALITTAVLTLGFDCQIKLETTDGEIIEIFSREVGSKAVDMGASMLEEVKEEVKDALHRK